MICDGHLYKIKILTQISGRHVISVDVTSEYTLQSCNLHLLAAQGAITPEWCRILTNFFFKAT